MKEQLESTQQLEESLCITIDSDGDDNSMMASSRRLRQVLPDATEYKKEGAEENFHYRPKSKREDDGRRGRSSVSKGSRQLVVYGEAAYSSSSRRHSRSIDKTKHHHRSAANYKKNDVDADRQLNGGDKRDHQLKKHSSSSRHHERRRRLPPSSSEEQSFSSFNTTSTHSTMMIMKMDMGNTRHMKVKVPLLEHLVDHHLQDEREGHALRQCLDLDHRGHHHHRQHSKEKHRSSYSPVRSRRPPRRPSPENNHLRSSFASHGSQRSSRTLPTSSSHHHSSKPPALLRRRSSDDLRALEADDLRAVERAARSSSSNRRRSGHHKKSSSSRRKDEPTVDTTVNVRVSRDVRNSSTTNSSSRIIDGKTPRKHNHTKSKKKKNSIDLTIDDNGQGTFQVVTSSSSTTTTSTPLQFDIQIDEANSSYLIQTSLGLLHHIREVHSPNTNILRTLTYWNQHFERDEVELGYHRGELGIVSMSSKDTKGVVPVPDGVKAKSSTFSNSQDVVLMILTGSYHGGKASSFEKDDVFIKELELFVTDSLWCYLRLHGLMEESSQQQQDQDEEGGDLGNGHADECVENIRNGSRKNLHAELKTDKKKERVLSRVFKRVIGE
eukprot:scaffold15922_cov104-Skeletonema_dohrnii-CCMP3373.AAC.10